MTTPTRLWPPPQRASFEPPFITVTEPAVKVGPCGLPAQGYRLRLTEGGVTIDAADDAGARYGRATLAQLATLYDGAPPCGLVEDWPAVATRGVMLDVSRSRVPALATLLGLIDLLAALKVNHLELYLEHTFAYAGHEEVWAKASPYTADDLRSVDDHAARRGVELTANQNCLGHMERWLRHFRYRELAIAPQGFTAPWGAAMPAMTMDPAHPGALALARDLLGQLLPNLRSDRVHVGLDEPWELAADRAPEWGAYLRALRGAPETAGHEVLAWADVPARHPELLAALPDGVTLCEWGYEADHPFEERAAALAEAGVPFWLCPGTSSWNSIGGRWTNAVDNIASAATAAAAHGAAGLLVTDWGDNGHLQHLAVAEPLIAWAAGCAWNPRDAEPDDLPDVVDRWIGSDAGRGFGAALAGLGDAHRAVDPQLVNQSILTAHLYRPEIRLGGGTRTRGLADADLAVAGAAIADAAAVAERSALARPDGDAVRREIVAAASLLALLVDDARARIAGDGSLASVAAAARRMFEERLNAIIHEHRRLWLGRDRPGGLDESVGVLDRLGAAYASPPPPRPR